MDKRSYRAGKCSLLKNDAGTQVSYWHKTDTTGSGDVLTDETKNLCAAVTASGADLDHEVGELRRNRTTVPRIIATHFGCGVAA